MAYKKKFHHRKRRAHKSRKNSVNGPKKFRISVVDSNLFTADGSGVIGQNLFTMDPSACTEWASLSLLYDQYKVNGIRVRYIPRFNVAQVSGGTASFANLYVAYDADSAAVPTTLDDLVQYGNFRMKDMSRPWKYSIHPRTQTDSAVNSAGLVSTYSKKNGVCLSVANYASYHKGVLGWYGTGFTPNLPYGSAVVDYWITFYGRR